MGPVDRALEKVPEMVDKISALFRKDKQEEVPAAQKPIEEELAETPAAELPKQEG